VNVEFTVKFIHFAGVEKDQANEDVDGALLGKPEAELVAPQRDGIKGVDQQDAKTERDNKPDDQAAYNQPEISSPVFTGAFHNFSSLKHLLVGKPKNRPVSPGEVGDEPPTVPSGKPLVPQEHSVKSPWG
jgi:hypothetical protein